MDQVTVYQRTCIEKIFASCLAGGYDLYFENQIVAREWMVAIDNDKVTIKSDDPE